MNSTPTVLVCAMKEELRALQNAFGPLHPGVVLKRAGIGPQSAARCAQEIKAELGVPRMLISTGFCGALVPGLKPGALVISHETADALSGTIYTSRQAQEFADHCVEKLKLAGLAITRGRTVCTQDPVLTPLDKRKLSQLCCAAAVDMESAALFAPFDPEKTICLVVRAVSDSSDDELPPEVADFLNRSGNPRLAKITAFVLKRPIKNTRRLAHLKRNADTAAASLTAAWRVLKTIL